MGRRRRAVGAAAGVLGLLLVAALLAPATPAAARGAGTSYRDATRLYLVTLDGPGTSARRSPLPRSVAALGMVARQDRVLARVGSPEPTYRWTTAINGFAVPLTPEQALELQTDDDVVLVEPNRVRPLAGRPAAARTGLPGPRRGGAGTVIGVVDTGLAPDSPVFSGAGRLGREPKRFRGPCLTGEDWERDDCDPKVVGARWFVGGFGEDRLRATEVLSARDSDGHGTQMASIAAGNARVPVRVGGQGLGRTGGMAPQARIAVYKACWGAPDPADDGCATADLVTAIDRATLDRVDVLSLSVGGPPEIDTVERALLGAAEAGIVVTAAAGNAGSKQYSAHPSPWVTTVGAATGQRRTGRIVVTGGPRLEGAMVSSRAVGPARLVPAARAAAHGATRGEARVCTPGSLDARRVEGAVVLCERGRVGRVDKSRAVRLADGVGMVLVNVAPGDVATDFHSVPTVHLAEQPGRTLRRWVARHPRTRVALRPLGPIGGSRAVARWSSPGSPLTGVLKPDVVAPGTGLLGAVPSERGWDFVSGTSAAAAYTAGAAATLLSRTGWSAPRVRSALQTTTEPVRGGVLHAGAGRLHPVAADRPGLVYEVRPGDYRRWLEEYSPALNTPSILFADDVRRTRRTITNVSGRRQSFSAQAVGFDRAVRVTPSFVVLGRGESATFRVRVVGTGTAADQGRIVWRGANGTMTSIPVQISR